MQKPIVVAMEELKENIMKAVQESGLPIFVVEPIMKEQWQQCSIANENYKRQQIQAYNEELKKAEKEGENAEESEVAPVQP